MKHLHRLTLLQIVAAIALALILAWQLASLAAMKGYLTAGLQARLAQVAGLAAQGLKMRFDAAVQEQLDAGLLALPHEKMHRDSLPSVSRRFARLSARISPVASWVVVLPPSQPGQSIELWKYESPGSYFRTRNPEGAWVRDESLAQRIEQMTTGHRNSVWGTLYWKNAVDSTLHFLYHNKNLNESLLVGFPVFERMELEMDQSGPVGFLFMEINLLHVEYPIAQEYLNQGFWEEHAGKVDFGKHLIDFGLQDENGYELLGMDWAELLRPQYETYYSLTLLDPYLSRYTLAAGFRGARSEQLATAIYRRNLYLVIGMFVALGLMLWVIFRSTRKSVRLSQLKSDFLAQVSHEIRTPLAGIRLAQDTLRLGRTQQESEIRQAHAVLAHESKRIEYLVDSFLDFARSDSGEKVFRKEKIRLEDWKTELIAMAERRFQGEPGFTLHVEDRVWEGAICGDRMGLEQILLIFLDNAIKYSGAGREINLRFAAGKDHFMLAVQDEGIGIAAADQQVIFDRFVRLGDRDAYAAKGHGMGLFIARSIARAHRGRILVESKPGQGATFTLSIPLQKDQP